MMPSDPDRLGVLVVDDEPSIRDGLKRVLEPMGYRVLTAGGGQEAWPCSPAEETAIVLLDLQTAGHAAAWTVLRVIRERHPHIVVIIITGFSTVQTAAEAMRNGAYDLLPKPFDPASCAWPSAGRGKRCAWKPKPGICSRSNAHRWPISPWKRAARTRSSTRCPSGWWSPTPAAPWC
jgi:CheY-like chemotaxis protein